MTFTETRSPTQTTSPSNTWVNATWEEFVAIADDPASEKKTCYYFNQQMRIETMGVGPDHAVDNGTDPPCNRLVLYIKNHRASRL